MAKLVKKPQACHSFISFSISYPLSWRVWGETLLGKTIRAQMAKRASKATGNGYFAVELEVVSPGKYAEAIAQFRQQHYSPRLFRELNSAPALENGNGK